MATLAENPTGMLAPQLPGGGMALAATAAGAGAPGAGGSLTTMGGAGTTGMAVATGRGATALMPTTGGALASLGGLGTVLSQPAVRKSMPAIIALLVVVVFGAVYFWMQEVPYRSVYPGMGEADQQSALETLKAANFNPRIDPSSGQLTVPVSRYHEARMLLSSQGLPRTQNRGILESLKDQSAMTTSQFMEQARYVAATEQELARSITQIGSIQTARVHLAQTRPSTFVRERTPSKASVIVTPYGGMQITPGQVQAIVHLVASSIPYLAASDVTVVDNLGNLISKAAVDDALGLTSLQAQHKHQAEENYRNRIVQLLEPVVGEGNVRAQVDLVMDFTEIETASEDYDARKAGPRTRSEALSEERASSPDTSGIPGALTNSPPPDSTPTKDVNTPQEPSVSSLAKLNSKTTRNYELDKQVRHVRSAQGAITRVSAAVVLRNRVATSKEADSNTEPGSAGFTPDEVKRFTELVQGVVGFNSDRGDVVTLVPARFEPVATGPAPAAWYENELALNLLKAGFASLMVIVILLTVIRPVIRSYLPAPVVVAAAGEPGSAGGALLPGGVPGAEGKDAGEDDDDLTMREGESLEDFKGRLKRASAPKKSSISADMLDTANTYDDKVALIRMLVREDSGRVATVLKNMIKRDLAV